MVQNEAAAVGLLVWLTWTDGDWQLNLFDSACLFGWFSRPLFGRERNLQRRDLVYGSPSQLCLH
jgi:hypothetical protein